MSIGSLVIATSASVVAQTSVVTINSVTGAGTFNLTAAPAPVSTLGNVALTYLGIPSGVVNINTIAVSFCFDNGTI